MVEGKDVLKTGNLTIYNLVTSTITFTNKNKNNSDNNIGGMGSCTPDSIFYSTICVRMVGIETEEKKVCLFRGTEENPIRSRKSSPKTREYIHLSGFLDGVGRRSV